MTYSRSFFEEMTIESLASAEVVVPLVLDLLHPKSVIDVGCGTGPWLSAFREQGVPAIYGLDGPYIDPVTLLIPSESFRTVDLAQPFSLTERYDLAISLEVAEHLPVASARGFVKSLCELAPFIVFSAAVPGQGGTHHVNEQWPEYWRCLFARQGFRMFDPFRPQLWYDERVMSHYRQNMFLFIRHDVLASMPEFCRLPEIKDGHALMLLDPLVLFSIRATIKRLPFMLWRSVSRRIDRWRTARKNGMKTERDLVGKLLPR